MATLPELVELLKSAGAPPQLAHRLAAISTAEDSPGDPTVSVHDPTANDPNAISVGHFQINSDNFAWLSKTLGTPVTAGALQASVELQARAACALATQTPNGLSNWTTWQSYLKDCAGESLTPSEKHAAGAIREALRHAPDPGSSDDAPDADAPSDAASSRCEAGGSKERRTLFANPIAVVAFPVIAIGAIAAVAFVSGFVQPHVAPGALPGAPREAVPASAPHIPPAPQGGVQSPPSYAAPHAGGAPHSAGAAPAGGAPAVGAHGGPMRRGSGSRWARGQLHPPSRGPNASIASRAGRGRSSGRRSTAGCRAAGATRRCERIPACGAEAVRREHTMVGVGRACRVRGSAHRVVAQYGAAAAQRRRDAAARRRRAAATRTTAASTATGPRDDVPVFKDM